MEQFYKGHRIEVSVGLEVTAGSPAYSFTTAKARKTSS